MDIQSSVGKLEYYDFDANWDAFLRAWRSPPVAHAADLDAAIWREMGFFKNYRHGDPLWKQTKTTYWIYKLAELAQAKAREERHAAMYRRTMDVVCPRLSSSALYYRVCFAEVIKGCEPRPGTIESFGMPEGAFVFKNALLECARALFPAGSVGMFTLNGRTLIVVDSKTVLDPFGYYFHRHDDDPKYDLSTRTTST